MAGEERRSEQVEEEMREPGAAKSFARWRCQELPGRSAARGAGDRGGRLQRGAAQGASLRGRREEARSGARDPGLCRGLRAQSSPAPPGGAPWLCSHLGVTPGLPQVRPARSTGSSRVGKPMRVLSCYLRQKDQILSVLQIAALPSSQPRTPHPAGAALQAPQPLVLQTRTQREPAVPPPPPPPRPWLPTGRCQTWG